jgi:hypothetical protein
VTSVPPRYARMYTKLRRMEDSIQGEVITSSVPLRRTISSELVLVLQCPKQYCGEQVHERQHYRMYGVTKLRRTEDIVQEEEIASRVPSRRTKSHTEKL